jgi:hypothetical protein
MFTAPLASGRPGLTARLGSARWPWGWRASGEGGRPSWGKAAALTHIRTAAARRLRRPRASSGAASHGDPNPAWPASSPRPSASAARSRRAQGARWRCPHHRSGLRRHRPATVVAASRSRYYATKPGCWSCPRCHVTSRLTMDNAARTPPQRTAFHSSRVLSLKPSTHGDTISHALTASVQMLQ